MRLCERAAPLSDDGSDSYGGPPSKESLRRDFVQKKKNAFNSARKPFTNHKKNKKGRKKNKGQEIFSNQLGPANLAALFAGMANIRGIKLTPDLMNKVENLIALFLAAKDCKTVSGLLATFFLYVKTHYSVSIANIVAEYLSDVLDSDFSPQSGEFNVKDERPIWLEMLTEIQSNWQKIVNNEGFAKISNCLSLALALGLCDASSLDFQIGGMRLFSIGAIKRHASAIDLVGAVMETVSYFVEGAYTCFEKRSIKPLLFGSQDEEDFEELYAKCLRCHDYAKCGNLEKFENMTESDYEALLCQTIERVNFLIITSKGLVEKNVFRRKLDILRVWQATFRQTRVQGGLREAPYCIGIYGGTSVGKSSIANILMVTTLIMNGYSATDDRIITINETDQFWSNLKTYINGIHVDDSCNTKPEYVTNPPTQIKLQLNNNVHMYAKMAEAEMKGKVSLEPKVVCETKNVKDGGATLYSHEPASIARRDRICITVTVKPEFATHDMLNEEKVFAAYPAGPPLIPDFWNIKVERAYPVPNKTKGGHATIGWRVVPDENGVPQDCVSLPDLIRFIKYDSAQHFKTQRSVVANGCDLAKKLDICPKCSLPTPGVCVCDAHVIGRLSDRCPESGYCSVCQARHKPIVETVEDDVDDDAMDNQLGELFVAAMLPKWRSLKNAFVPKVENISRSFEEMSIKYVLKKLEWLENSRWVSWTNWVPSEWLDKPLVTQCMFMCREKELHDTIRRSFIFHIFILLFNIFLCFLHPVFVVLVFYSIFCMAGIVEVEKKRLYDRIVADNQAMPLLFRTYRDNHVKWITGACVTLGILYALSQVWKCVKCIPSPQGNIAPTCDADIVERDSEINPWANVVVSEMPCSQKSKTTTPDQLSKKVENNLTHMQITVKTGGVEKHYHCDAFFMESNVALVPKHMWKADNIFATFTRRAPGSIGSNFKSWLYRGHSMDVGGDLTLAYVPNGGDWEDLSSYLPTQRFANVPARLIYKDAQGECKTTKLMMECGDVITYAASFFGAKYTTTFDTFEGLCMATLVTETKGPMIGGFHLGGKNGENRGCSQLLLKEDLDAAIAKLKQCPGVVLAKSSGTMPKEQYDVQFFQGTDVHPKSPINFLPKDANCKYYGQVIGRASYHSEVQDSCISETVEEVTGVPQKWGKPQFGGWRPWQASLQYSCKPSVGIEGSLLVRACKDYIKPILDKLDNMWMLKSNVRPLTEMETVCGIDGLRFIDKMPANTSVGYPLGGPKSNHLTELNPEDYPDQQYPVELDRRFWTCAYEMEERYLRNERCYPIFKASLKDEPTPLDKDKVRVFQAAPIALQLLVRKYFLPIARVLSMLPLDSECAVGINSQGPEWDTLSSFIKKHGEDRILAGDYSKYDLRMPAQVMLAAFRILIDIGRHCGYSERDISIMEGLATDITYPLMAYNGDLIQLYGSNPSGQNMTVFINGIVNSLLFRCAFFHIKGIDTKEDFRSVVALGTYGDDAKSSVKKGHDDFNHIALAKFLEDRDMKFTMPDKKSTPTPYMKDVDADFLKRKNVFSPDTNQIMAALDEDSIFKSLHANLKSQALTKEQQAMQNIDGALREWFNHGRAVYEFRREQMQRVAQKADIAHGCRMLNISYDECLENWRAKYAPPQA